MMGRMEKSIDFEKGEEKKWTLVLNLAASIVLVVVKTPELALLSCQLLMLHFPPLSLAMKSANKIESP
jgi:hypothetical protein